MIRGIPNLKCTQLTDIYLIRAVNFIDAAPKAEKVDATSKKQWFSRYIWSLSTLSNQKNINNYYPIPNAWKIFRGYKKVMPWMSFRVLRKIHITWDTTIKFRIYSSIMTECTIANINLVLPIHCIRNGSIALSICHLKTCQWQILVLSPFHFQFSAIARWFCHANIHFQSMAWWFQVTSATRLSAFIPMSLKPIAYWTRYCKILDSPKLPPRSITRG
jgi:hypothetical protein